MSKTFQTAALTAHVASVLVAAGSSAEEANTVASHLVLANLSGHDSHGVGMLPRYVDAVLEGGLNPNTGVKVLLDSGSLLTLDGQRGYGQVLGAQAMALGIARAQEHGSCIMTLANAHHLARIGHYAEMAVAQGLVSIHFVNVLSRPVVAPFGGADGRYGTNPCCIGIPLKGHRVANERSEGPPRASSAPEGLEPAAPSLLAQAGTGDRGEASCEPRPARPREPHTAGSVGASSAAGPSQGGTAPPGGSEPHAVGSVGAHFILDFATSRVAQGKMRVAHNEGRRVQSGMLIDEHGHPTTDPGVVVVPQSNGLFGALMAFGEHKGYGMAVACELLGGALTGSGTAHKAADPSVRAVINGMLTILIDPAKLGTQASFEQEALAFINWVQAAPAAAGFDGVQIAGDPERVARIKRQAEGVVVDIHTWDEIIAAGQKVGLSLQA